ncbi:MAG: UvrD-helicase domain-containing protein [Fibromonadales bacterium]|nr:UvrD-helicase domain-containing protein [Fibromonadales bacterium]
MQELNVREVSLKKKVLIEASAGTGKTYTIGLIVIRLLLEEKIPVQKIVLITFTDAATAELKKKTAEKIIEALDRWENNSEDDDLNAIVRKAATSEDAQIKRANLLDAIARIDEMPVFTIHGFCTRLLNEFAYETQNFEEREIIKNQSDIENRIAADFWREEICKLSTEEIAALPANFSLDSLKTGFKHVLNFPQATLLPKEYENKSPITENYFETKANAEKKTQEIESLHNEVMEKNPEMEFNKTDGKINAKKAKQNLLFVQFNACMDDLGELRKILSEKEKTAVAILQYKLAKKLLTSLQAEKDNMKVRSFGDLIKDASDAVVKEHKKMDRPLFNAVQKKYDAILVDEFQDTDAMQFEIFNYLFCGKPFFIIGDPKQAIYRFRGGDIYAYLEAGKTADEQYTLNYNFRSQQKLLDGLNKVFKIENPFETEEIKYRPVKRKKDLSTELRINSEPLVLRNFAYSSKSQALKEIRGEVVKEITRLLYEVAPEISDKDTGDTRKIGPRDIAILTRTNDEARNYRNALLNIKPKSIPAVIRRSDGVFKSFAADYIRRLLTAFIHSKKESRVKAALMEPKALCADDIKPFAKAFEIWKKFGVMLAINSYLDSMGLWKKIRCEKNGERNITNLRQLIGILNEEESVAGRVPERTLRRFAMLIQGDTTEEHEEKLETDDDAVQIMTIHTSKGLQFPIVFVPDLMITKSNDPSVYHKDGEIFIEYNSGDAQKAELKELKEESARNFYVAVTRPIYRLYIINAYKESKNGEKKAESAGQKICMAVEGDENIRKLADEKLEKIEYASGSSAEIAIGDDLEMKSPKTLPELAGQPWKKTSFSGIAKKLEYKHNDSEKSDQESIPGGKNVGNLLHGILENLDFAAPRVEIQKAVKDKLEGLSEFSDAHKETITDWMKTILEKKLDGTAGKLCNVDVAKRMSELRFFMSSKSGKIDLSKIKKVVNIPDIIEDKLPSKYLDGIIDLVFLGEDDKYYILDWKSNKLDNYEKQELEEVMHSHSYHLQYYIYAVALKRWLNRMRGPGYFEKNFGGVHYVFLRGVKKDPKDFAGIYFKPKEDIMNSIEKLDEILTEK